MEDAAFTAARRSPRRVPVLVILIHNLSITLWLAIYDLSKALAPQRSEFLILSLANVRKARNSCCRLQYQ